MYRVCPSPFAAAPYWIKKPHDLPMGLGATATFTCASSGDPARRVQWLINSLPIDEMRALSKRLYMYSYSFRVSVRRVLAFAFEVTSEPGASVDWQLAYLHGRVTERLASDLVQTSGATYSPTRFSTSSRRNF